MFVAFNKIGICDEDQGPVQEERELEKIEAKNMKKLILLLMIMNFAGAIGTANALVFDFNGHDYVVMTYEDQDWLSANQHMTNNLGADYHLATIDSDIEQEFIISLLGPLTGEYWLGGLQDESDNWTWVTGEQWLYTHWGEGEANDAYGPGSEQYLAMWSRYSGWGWNDEGWIPNISGYIAERESAPAPVPEPATILLLGTGLIGLAGIRRKKMHR